MADKPRSSPDAEARRSRCGDVRVRLRARAVVRRVLRRSRAWAARRRTSAAVVVERPNPNRIVRVEFLGSVARGSSWQFEPDVSHLDVHPGQLYETHFRARNLRDTERRGSGRAERRARQRGAVLPQDRMLLLHAARRFSRTKSVSSRSRSCSRRSCRRTWTRYPCRIPIFQFPKTTKDSPRHGTRALPLLRAARHALADRRLDRAVHHVGGQRSVAEPVRAGALDRAHRLRDSARDDLWLVQRRDRREPARPLQPEGRFLVPLGHELVHLLGGHVLRRILRRAVLHARARDAVARRRRQGLLHARCCCGRISSTRGRRSARRPPTSSSAWKRGASPR